MTNRFIILIVLFSFGLFSLGRLDLENASASLTNGEGISDVRVIANG